MKMKERLRRFFTENISLKLIAVVMAFVFWITFITIEDPVSTDTYRISVQVNHLQEYLAKENYIELKNGSDISKLTLSVTIRARMSVLKEIKEKDIASVVTAYVDVYDEEGGILKVRYDIDRAYEDKIEIPSLLNTSYLEVITEGKATKSIPLHQTITGSLEEGYIFFENEVDISPETIDVTGPASKIEEFAYGQINLTLRGEKDIVYQKLDVNFYREDGSKIEFSRDLISTSVSVASINVPVYQVKEVPLKAQLTGEAANGYAYLNDLSLSQDTIKIYGKESTLDLIEEINLPEIDISEIRGSYETKYSLTRILSDAYGDTVKLYMDEAKEVELTLTTKEKEQRNVTVSLENLDVTGLFIGWQSRWRILPQEQEIEVVMVGLPEEIDTAIRRMRVSVALTEEELQEGTRGEYTVNFSGIPQGVDILEIPTIQLQITSITGNESE